IPRIFYVREKVALRFGHAAAWRLQFKREEFSGVPQQQVGGAGTLTETLEDRGFDRLAITTVCGMRENQARHATLAQVLNDGAVNLLFGAAGVVPHGAPPSAGKGSAWSGAFKSMGGAAPGLLIGLNPVPSPFNSRPAASPMLRTRRQRTPPRHVSSGEAGSWPAATNSRHSFKTGEELRATIPHAVAWSDHAHSAR